MHRRRPGHRHGRRERQLSGDPTTRTEGPAARDTEVARDLFLYWLRDTHSRGFAPSADPASGVFTDGEHTLALDARALVDSDDPRWDSRRRDLESLLAEDLPARIALWVPAGADLPTGEPATSEFIALVRQAAVRLGPHERSHVSLPAQLRLRKNSDEGGVISVTGGLNPFWARFTGRVQGAYDLDSTEIHRLPESGDHLERLLGAVVERAATLEAGQVAIIDTVDSWTIQRLSGSNGVTIVGVPPSAADDLGLTVRRNFRRTLADAAPKLRAAAADLRALVVLAPYARIEHEGATTAMRGYDPTLYSGLDFIALATDGLIKPLITPPDPLLPWNRPTP